MSIGGLLGGIPGLGDVSNPAQLQQQLGMGDFNLSDINKLTEPGKLLVDRLSEEAGVAAPRRGLGMGPQTPRVSGVSSGDSFGNMLSRAIQSVDQSMKTAENSAEDFIAGKTENVHEVMINMQRAQLSFQLMLEIRNKAIETYQELSRMQI
jgi:flagellar hook-basal body complex protein FliE